MSHKINSFSLCILCEYQFAFSNFDLHLISICHHFWYFFSSWKENIWKSGHMIIKSIFERMHGPKKQTKLRAWVERWSKSRIWSKNQFEDWWSKCVNLNRYSIRQLGTVLGRALEWHQIHFICQCYSKKDTQLSGQYKKMV